MPIVTSEKAKQEFARKPRDPSTAEESKDEFTERHSVTFMAVGFPVMNRPAVYYLASVQSEGITHLTDSQPTENQLSMP